MSADYIVGLLKKYKRDGAILDTNLMLLFAIGTLNPDRISTFKRTITYSVSDFLLLSRMLELIDRRVTTPNIMTEVDNLGRQLGEREHALFSEVLSQLCSSTFEVYMESQAVMQSASYPGIGLTDSITLELSKEKLLVITDDFTLSNRIASLGQDVININHIRDFSL